MSTNLDEMEREIFDINDRLNRIENRLCLPTVEEVSGDEQAWRMWWEGYGRDGLPNDCKGYFLAGRRSMREEIWE